MLILVNNGKEIWPRIISGRNKGLFLYNNQIGLLPKSQSISFNQAIYELKTNFRMVDKYTTEENVNSFFKHEFKPQKIESQMTNFFEYDLKTHNTEGSKPYIMTFHQLSKLAVN